jgi:RNA polymerase sigma-70 factor (ECF subfamily)
MEIEKLYHRYGPMVMRRCRQLLQDENDALDATQDVFVRLLEHRKRLSEKYPSSLLYRIATNICLNRIRDRRRHGEVHDDDILYQLADIDEPISRFEVRSLLDRLFGQQKESTRTIAVLHYVDGMTLEETAKEVGLSVSGVRKRLRNLRASLEEMEES